MASLIYIQGLKLELTTDCEYSSFNEYCRAGKIVDITRKPEFTDTDCSHCKGRGELLTDAGRGLLEFTRAWADFKED